MDEEETLFLLIFALTVGGEFYGVSSKPTRQHRKKYAMKMYLTLESNGKGVDQR